MASQADGGIRAVKAGRNQALWREVNERIKAIAAAAGDVDFLRECARLDCTETVTLSMAAYERIRSSPTRFPIMVGQDFPEFEKVVETVDDYVVVEKEGVAAAEVTKLDPRARTVRRTSISFAH